MAKPLSTLILSHPMSYHVSSLAFLPQSVCMGFRLVHLDTMPIHQESDHRDKVSQSGLQTIQIRLLLSIPRSYYLPMGWGDLVPPTLCHMPDMPPSNFPLWRYRCNYGNRCPECHIPSHRFHPSSLGWA